MESLQETQENGKGLARTFSIASDGTVTVAETAKRLPGQLDLFREEVPCGDVAAGNSDAVVVSEDTAVGLCE
jgi:hypothetical protein